MPSDLSLTTTSDPPVTVDHLRGFYSPELGDTRPIEIFLPPGYTSADNTRYKVLYANDGQDMEALHLCDTLNRLYAQDRIEEIIVVAVYATPNRLQEYGTAGISNARSQGRLAAEYTRLLIDDIMPYINRKYRTLTGAANTAIMGASLGGLMAFDIAWNHPDLFGTVGVFSGSLWWRTDEADTAARQESRILHRIVRDSPKRDGLRLWFEAGTEDEAEDRDDNGVIDTIQDTTELMDELAAKGYRPGIDLVYVEMVGGEHNQTTWARALPEFLKWTFPTAIERWRQRNDHRRTRPIVLKPRTVQRPAAHSKLESKRKK